MNIADWPDHKMMSLPDHLFGERFVMAETIQIVGPDYGFAIVDAGLPDRAVIWEIFATSSMAATGEWNFRLLLSDTIPTTHAQCNGLESINPFCNTLLTGTGWLFSTGPNLLRVGNIRRLLRPQGRRMVIEVYNGAAATKKFMIGAVYSGVPKDLPEWKYR